jgi:predicted SprT family Zn-dependent metalloprotease
MTLPKKWRVRDDDLDARIARTRVLLKCSSAIRASVRSHHASTFTPLCVDCQQSGRTHHSPLTSEQHYVCAHCGGRWSVQSSVR